MNIVSDDVRGLRFSNQIRNWESGKSLKLHGLWASHSQIECDSIGSTYKSHRLYDRSKLSAPPTRCKLPVTKTSSPSFSTAISRASIKASSIVGSTYSRAFGSSCSHRIAYSVRKSGKGVSGTLRVLSIH